MSIRQSSPNAPSASELPQLIQMKNGLTVAKFSLMKLLPARFMLDRARDAGLLKPDYTVIESTSGTLGLALAMLCGERGYKLHLVCYAIQDQLRRRLEDLGAYVEMVTERAPVGGYQRARLDRIAEILAQRVDYYWPSQYDNPHNPGAYAPFAELVVEALGKVDYLVGPVGSGGCMSGTSAYLRVPFPHLEAIGVDTHGSVLFGQPEWEGLLAGIGSDIMMGNLNHTAFDEVHWVNAAEAFVATRELHRHHAIFMGPTSGAVYLVAQWIAAHHPNATTVAILPDEGFRYVETVYSDDWLRAHDVWRASMPREPILVASPRDTPHDWARFLWARRTYEQVMGHTFDGSDAADARI